ncbi:DUF4183 domain-containing protein [Bacillus sp. E(2018)]|uniref:DUF4183 domain-containing protein n=1 Tax=Bacillus sp. E(2018) TaxID=2502239 RepID=UPI0010FA1A2C|nr:DUF4183 domain-containing protein [Bacillus sp. E(2018)]
MFHKPNHMYGKRKTLFDRCYSQHQTNKTLFPNKFCRSSASYCTCCDCSSCEADDYYYFSCPAPVPFPPFPPVPPSPRLLRVETYQYTTVSDGIKRIYTNDDRYLEYESTEILNPNTVSYINLFVNGMLQPSSFYEVEEGRLTLLPSAGPVPDQGIPLILQFIKIINSG